MATPFKKLNTKVFKKGSEVTPEYIYWKKLGTPVIKKQVPEVPIDFIDFSPVEPYHFAVTCFTRVEIYNPITKLVLKKISRFRNAAHGAVFRHDGKLICAGDEDANVRLFDAATQDLLRLFKGHQAPVHRTAFIYDKPQLASFADDKIVKIWDIATEQNVVSFSGHTDYIRAGTTNPVISNVVLSGGYDNKVKMYDIRTSQQILDVDHGSPVESLLFLPSGSIFLSAGGTEIKIWDTIAGGKLLGSISRHHKTITCLRLASNNKRLLSASLDRHVKIYDLDTYKVVHTLDFPEAVLSLGISKTDDTLVAGTVSGLLSINRRESQTEPLRPPKKARPPSSQNVSVPKETQIVPQFTKEKMAKYDNHLRKFEYSRALDCGLVPYVANKHPEVTVTIMKELINRRALHKALQDREQESLLRIIRFFIRNITDYRFTRVLVDAASIFLDVHEETMTGIVPSEIAASLAQLQQLLDDDIKLTEDMQEIAGVLELLLATNDAV